MILQRRSPISPRCAPLRPRGELVELVDPNSRPDCSSIVRVHGGFQSRERAPLSRAACKSAGPTKARAPAQGLRRDPRSYSHCFDPQSFSIVDN